jgi:hypothetical protein
MIGILQRRRGAIIKHASGMAGKHGRGEGRAYCSAGARKRIHPGAYSGCSAVYFSAGSLSAGSLSAGSRERKDEHKRTVNLNYTHTAA